MTRKRVFLHTVMSKNNYLCFLVLGTIISSVGVIHCNKYIMQRFQFSFVLSLTFLHLFLSAIFFYCIQFFNLFQEKHLPSRNRLVTGFFTVLSIIFMNLSLQFNSVGFYQITKLLTIPLTLFAQYFMYRTKVTVSVAASICFLLLGVAICTVTDMEVNLKGLFFGSLAIISTTISQIYVGEDQKAFRISGLQMYHTLAIPTSVITLIGCLMTEWRTAESLAEFCSFFSNFEFCFWIMTSAALALGLNFFTISLIGLTSPVTNQVVNHSKTVLVMLLGLLLSPNISQTLADEAKRVVFLKNVLGMTIAVVSVVWYGYIKMQQGSSRAAAQAAKAKSSSC